MSLALLVHACDKHSFVFERFLNAFEYFNLDIPCYFSTESSSINNKKFKNININESIWSKRFKLVLNNIQEKNIVLLQEDFIVKYFNKELFLSLYNFHNEQDSDITKTGSFPTFSLKNTSYKNIYAQNNGHYLMSHQPIAIFKKEFLLSTLDIDQNASQHEMYWSEKIKNKKIFCYGLNHLEHQMNNEIFAYEHVIRQGKLIA
jgi:hypothetical protein